MHGISTILPRSSCALKLNRLPRQNVGNKALIAPYFVGPLTPIEHVQPFVKETVFRMPIASLKPPPLGSDDYQKMLEGAKKHLIDKVSFDKDLNKAHIFQKDGHEVDIDVEENQIIEMIDTLTDNDVKIIYKTSNDIDFGKYLVFAGYILQYFFMILTGVMLVSIFMSRGSGGVGPGMFGKFAEAKAKFHEEPETGVKFPDVAGLEYAKLELQEIVDFLKTPEKFAELGAKIPKGCLLVGPPGCGKTLLGRAIAGEAGVPFFSCSASEFLEMFVGVGASRIRNLFSRAKEKAPCIIFIDEIDAVGKVRSSGPVSSDERDQTINQLLTEMDGFEGNTGVIVIAATNREDVLDPALMRAGRFDRKINIELPDFQGRCQILDVHMKTKPKDDSVVLEKIAKVTAGFSGADLANLANESAIIAVRREHKKITSDDIDYALEKISMGPEKKSKMISAEKKKIVAYHEAGHALTSILLFGYDTLRKVTIIPRASAGGMTMFIPADDHVDSGLYSKDYLEKQMMVALGGRIAEEIILGKEHVTTGASGDIDQVYKIAYNMVAAFGFSSELGAVGWKEKNVSPHTENQIDDQVKLLASNAYEATLELLQQNKHKLDQIADALLEKETLSGEDIKMLLG
jgi:cell division protease FtsH